MRFVSLASLKRTDKFIDQKTRRIAHEGDELARKADRREKAKLWDMFQQKKKRGEVRIAPSLIYLCILSD